MTAFAPTKSVLRQVRRTLAFAREGHELLERKREFLVLELMRYVERVRALEAEFSRETAAARAAYGRALCQGGLAPLRASGQKARQTYELVLKESPLMGMTLVEASLAEDAAREIACGPDGSAARDGLAAAMRRLLEVLVELAAVKATVWQLAREVKKTQRRVNALDRIVIPENEAIEKFIVNVLEESERSAFFVQKRLRDAKRNA